MMKFEISAHLPLNPDSIVFRASSKGEIFCHKKWESYAPLKFCGKVIRWIFLWDTHLGRVRDGFIKAHQAGLKNLNTLEPLQNHYSNLFLLNKVIRAHNQKWGGWQTTLLFWTRVPEIPNDIFENIKKQMDQQLKAQFSFSIDPKQPSVNQIQRTIEEFDKMCATMKAYDEWLALHTIPLAVPQDSWKIDSIGELVSAVKKHVSFLKTLTTQALISTHRSLPPSFKEYMVEAYLKDFLVRIGKLRELDQKMNAYLPQLKAGSKENFETLFEGLKDLRIFEILAQLPKEVKKFDKQTSEAEKAWEKELKELSISEKLKSQATLFKNALKQAEMLKIFWKFFESQKSPSHKECLSSFNAYFGEKRQYLTKKIFEEKILNPILKTVDEVVSKKLGNHFFVQALKNALSDPKTTDFQTFCRIEGDLFQKVSNCLKDFDFTSQYPLTKVVKETSISEMALRFYEEIAPLDQVKKKFFVWFHFIQKAERQSKEFKSTSFEFYDNSWWGFSQEKGLFHPTNPRIENLFTSLQKLDAFLASNKDCPQVLSLALGELQEKRIKWMRARREEYEKIQDIKGCLFILDQVSSANRNELTEEMKNNALALQVFLQKFSKEIQEIQKEITEWQKKNRPEEMIKSKSLELDKRKAFLEEVSKVLKKVDQETGIFSKMNTTLKFEDLREIASAPLHQYEKIFQEMEDVFKTLDSTQQQKVFPVLTFLRARHEMWNKQEALNLTNEDIEALNKLKARAGCPEIMQRQIDLFLRSSHLQFHPRQECPISFDAISNPVRLELKDRFFYFEQEELKQHIDKQFEDWKKRVASQIDSWLVLGKKLEEIPIPLLAFKDHFNTIIHESDNMGKVKYKNCERRNVALMRNEKKIFEGEISVPLPTPCPEAGQFMKDFEVLTKELKK